MTIVENYYQRILDSKYPGAIRKQIVEFFRDQFHAVYLAFIVPFKILWCEYHVSDGLSKNSDKIPLPSLYRYKFSIS